MGIYKAESIVLRSRVYGSGPDSCSLYQRSRKGFSHRWGVRKTTSRLREQCSCSTIPTWCSIPENPGHSIPGRQRRVFLPGAGLELLPLPATVQNWWTASHRTRNPSPGCFI